MESFKIENLSFTYPAKSKKALDNVSFSVKSGEFVLLSGKSGCGKSTLLRLLKTSLSPYGEIDGSIYYNNKPLASYDVREQASQIGFVLQSPDNQIVTDKVWHELAFGLESLGCKTPEIRARVSEMAAFFGIQTWFHKKVTELSGGQKQLLNLASVMVMQPQVLILDEPTSQLDPIASQEFLKTLEKINRELGTTVILTEHRLEEAFPLADRVIVMDDGCIIADAAPREVCRILKESGHDMYSALPTPMRIHSVLDKHTSAPLTVREGRCWLENYADNNILKPELIPKDKEASDFGDAVIEMKDVWFRYEKDMPDVIKGLDLRVQRGELFAIVGGNGTGKTTALSLICGLNKPYRGKVIINGRDIKGFDNLYSGIMGVLPQNPQNVFVKKTVYLDLAEILKGKKISDEEKELRIQRIAALCRIEKLLASHPYDLSGGEQQRAALAKVLLSKPQILLLDEPTKGMDAHFKEEFADILKDLQENGVTVVMVSHDIEFCAEYADRCALFFDGGITSSAKPREFFCGKNFYTTAANRMARTRLPGAVLQSDILLAAGINVEKKKRENRNIIPHIPDMQAPIHTKQELHRSYVKSFIGCVFAVLFILTSLIYSKGIKLPAFSFLNRIDMDIIKLLLVAETTGVLLCIMPRREFGIKAVQEPKSDRRLTKRTICAAVMILILIPLTIYIGVYFLGNRKYYFISLLIMLETILPFCMVFEERKPKARELIIISVLCALAVAGRAAFFMLPQFKPVVAMVIIAGVCFGGETGFLVGTVTGFVSNFFFGQGPWTVWQMFAFGIIGFIAGILFKKGFLLKTRTSLIVFGFVSTLVIYGGIMNPAAVIMWQNTITREMIAAAYLVGLPFDIIHALSTAFFLWFIAEPMIDKLERIKVKYGLIER